MLRKFELGGSIAFHKRTLRCTDGVQYQTYQSLRPRYDYAEIIRTQSRAGLSLHRTEIRSWSEFSSISMSHLHIRRVLYSHAFDS